MEFLLFLIRYLCYSNNTKGMTNMKKRTDQQQNEGFTLSELLVVVAIIAVLVAISIPIFTSQLHKAKVATDWANLRALYAEIQVQAAEDGDYSYGKGCTVSSDYKTITCDGEEKVQLEVGGIYSHTGDNQMSGYEYYFYYMCSEFKTEHSLLLTNKGITTYD